MLLALGTRRLTFNNGSTSCLATPDLDGDGDHDIVACQLVEVEPQGSASGVVVYEHR